MQGAIQVLCCTFFALPSTLILIFYQMVLYTNYEVICTHRFYTAPHPSANSMHSCSFCSPVRFGVTIY